MMLPTVMEDDLPTFFEHQLDPEATRSGGASREGVGRFRPALAAQGLR